MVQQDLTGIWACNDGGRYYLQQNGSQIWWAGFSGDRGLQNGLMFCNVFSGSFERDQITGQWADVPRGATTNFGSLELTPQFNPDGSPSIISLTSQTGGFSGSIWTFSRAALPANPDQPLQDVFNNTSKNIYNWYFGHESLGDNLEIAKDSVVVYGTLNPGSDSSEDPIDNSFPPNEARTWDNFWNMNHWWDADLDQSDGDMSGYISVDQTFLPLDLYTGMTPAHQTEVASKITVNIHPEMIMFSASGANDSPQLLPGWGQQDGNSVPVNGRPLNGDVAISASGIATAIAGHFPAASQPVRISGALVFDVGHPERQLELHPVYSIDFIGSNSADISGVWGDSDGSTYYIHNVFGIIFMLIAPPFRDHRFAAVFVGNLANNRASGNWSSIPYGTTPGSGSMFLLIDSSNQRIVIAGDNPKAGYALRKLYDAPGHACPLLGALHIKPIRKTPCQVVEFETSTAQYGLTAALPASLASVTYQWTASAGVAGDPTQSKFQVSQLPAAGTQVTITVTVTMGQCSYQGTRTFTTISAQQAAWEEELCLIIQRLIQSLQTLINQPILYSPGDPPPIATVASLNQFLAALSQSAQAVEQLSQNINP